MITADIPMTISSTADLSLSLPDFIEYSIKNDMNIVTTKWLAHTRKITITEARNTLKHFWDTIGKAKGYSATFSALSKSESEGFTMELIDANELEGLNTISLEIYAVHAVPLKDKAVQLGMINVPIYDLAGEFKAPWIDTENFPKLEASENVMNAHKMDEGSEEIKLQFPPEKKTKLGEEIVKQEQPAKQQQQQQQPEPTATHKVKQSSMMSFFKKK